MPGAGGAQALFRQLLKPAGDFRVRAKARHLTAELSLHKETLGEIRRRNFIMELSDRSLHLILMRARAARRIAQDQSTCG